MNGHSLDKDYTPSQNMRGLAVWDQEGVESCSPDPLWGDLPEMFKGA